MGQPVAPLHLILGDEELLVELEAAAAERDRCVHSAGLAVARDLAGPAAAVRWDQMAVSSRGAVLEVLGLNVRILPRVKHSPGFEPATVKVAWHG